MIAWRFNATVRSFWRVLKKTTDPKFVNKYGGDSTVPSRWDSTSFVILPSDKIARLFGRHVATMNKKMNPAFFRLDFDLSVTHLQDDLRVCEGAHWISHHNQQDYTGSWSSISLRSVSGASDDIRSFSDKAYIDTPLLARCPYFSEVATLFECEKESIRLLRLEPQAKIKEHTDPAASYEEGFFRIHIPILTNELVVFCVNKELVPMKEGECWYANFELPHSVENNSDMPRVHLVIDCKRNEWSDSIFLEAGFDLNAVSERHLLDDKTKLLVIEELLRDPSETNLKVVAKLRGELAAA